MGEGDALIASAAPGSPSKRQLTTANTLPGSSSGPRQLYDQQQAAALRAPTNGPVVASNWPVQAVYQAWQQDEDVVQLPMDLQEKISLDVQRSLARRAQFQALKEAIIRQRQQQLQGVPRPYETVQGR